MPLNPQRRITLAEARDIVRRAIDKAEDLRQAGPFVVVDEGGVQVTSSRMDNAAPFGMAIVRGKAYFASVARETTANLLDRLEHRFFGIYEGYRQLTRERIFPGKGAFLIRRDGQVIGAVSTGASIGPFVKIEGVDPSKLVVDGKPANVEDLIVSYALGEPYQPQHGDDMPRWLEAFKSPPGVQGTGLAEPPRASRQAILRTAIGLADAAIALAVKAGLRISVAIVDRSGDLIQLDRMDHAAPVTPDLAEAVASTAAAFGCPSADAGKAPGGTPIEKGGVVEGAVGVSGGTHEQNAQIAEAVARL